MYQELELQGSNVFLKNFLRIVKQINTARRVVIRPDVFVFVFHLTPVSPCE